MKKKRGLRVALMVLLLLIIVLIVVIGKSMKTNLNKSDEVHDETISVNVEAAEDESKDESIDLVIEEENIIPEEIDEAYLEGLREKYSQPTLVMGDVKGATDEAVTVRVLALNNPGILGMCATLSYDENIMELESVENGDIFEGILDFTRSDDLKSGCRFLWDGIDIESEQIKDGEIMQMTFKIKDSAKSGRYPISLVLDEGSTVNRELGQLDLVLDCGYITVN